MAQVTVSDTQIRLVYSVGAVATDEFAFSFTYYADTDIEVYDDGTLVDAADYTVTGNGSTTDGYAGGTVTLDTAVTNTTIIVQLNLTLEKTVNFPVAADFDIAALNTQLSKLWSGLLQVRDLYTRALKLPVDSALVDGSGDVLDLAFTEDPEDGKTPIYDATLRGFKNSTASISDLDGAITQAEAAQTAAELARDNAQTAETNAETAETNAETAQAAAESARDDAQAALAEANLPGTLGTAGQLLKVNAGADALEYDDPANVVAGTLSDDDTLADESTTQAPTERAVKAYVDNSTPDPYDIMPIGMPFILDDHLTGCPIPDNSGDAKYIRLTAGQTGAGQFNEGLLTSESTSGSAPLVVSTAVIDYAESPIDGETIHHLNTMEAIKRPRTTSGEVQQDQMQRITGSLTNENVSGPRGLFRASSGVFSLSGSGTGGDFVPGGTASRIANFDSMGSPNARVSSSVNGETRSKNVSGTAYMRIA